VGARHLLFEDAADGRDLTRVEEYERVGGYESLRKALGMEPQQVLDELLAANLRGRGGAGFPMGRKASFLPKPEQAGKPIYLTANADESEPGTFKDREIMLRIPHAIVEGVLIACWAIQADAAFIYIRGEYLTEFEVLRGREPARLWVVASDRAPPRRRRLHLRRGDVAARVARGQARLAAHEAAFPGDLGRLRLADAHQQRRDARDGAEGDRARR
jgi:hypothetical protein